VKIRQISVIGGLSGKDLRNEWTTDVVGLTEFSPIAAKFRA
jgi:hypothetical protein